MRIEESSVLMASKSTYTESFSERESLKIWADGKSGIKAKANKDMNIQNKHIDVLEISDTGRGELKRARAAREDDKEDSELSYEDKRKILLIEKFIEALSGKKVKLQVSEKMNEGAFRKNIGTDYLPANHENTQIKSGWGLEYDYQREYYEKETMTFSAKGRVKTSDGRNIEFSIDMDIKREFLTSESISIRAGDAKMIDPLVINFGNSSVKLSDNKIDFDLNFDGTTEKISFISEESGFVALDLNNDGIINDGKELFGPQSGDGFAELEKYDLDGNKWIDENDAIFSNLKIWVKDGSGKDVLFSLAEKGVGALYIGNVNTPFSLKDNSNNLNGEIQKTGIYLKENGLSGTIQHIDLAI